MNEAVVRLTECVGVISILTALASILVAYKSVKTAEAIFRTQREAEMRKSRLDCIIRFVTYRPVYEDVQELFEVLAEPFLVFNGTPARDVILEYCKGTWERRRRHFEEERTGRAYRVKPGEECPPKWTDLYDVYAAMCEAVGVKRLSEDFCYWPIGRCAVKQMAELQYAWVIDGGRVCADRTRETKDE